VAPVASRAAIAAPAAVASVAALVIADRAALDRGRGVIGVADAPTVAAVTSRATIAAIFS
jgi:hypothetical protein